MKILWIKLSRSFGWSTLLGFQKPSPIVLAVIPIAATIKVILDSLGITFQLPIRPLLLTIGTISLLIAWGGIRLLCPKSIRCGSKQSEIVERGGLPPFLSTIEADIDSYTKSISPLHLQKSVYALLDSAGKPPAHFNASNPLVTRSVLVHSMTNSLDNTHLGLVMDFANSLFEHQRKWAQILLFLLAVIGYILLGISYSIAVYQLLK